MLDVLAIVLKAAGVLFLALAALGVARLPDPFQRMHAATKAGTFGASLVLIGVAFAARDAGAAVTAALTVLFLLLTLPVSAQLLGRAAYMSGATLKGLSRPDPLAGILDRRKAPLEERIEKDDAAF